MSKPSPEDGAFRRGLLILLVVVGVIASAAYLTVRESAKEDNARYVNSEVERKQLLEDVSLLLENQASERLELEVEQRRVAALEQLVVDLLGDSTDPRVAGAFERFEDASPTAEQSPQSQPQSQQPAPQSQPQPQSTAKPTPEPEPTPEPPIVTVPPLPLPAPSLCLPPVVC